LGSARPALISLLSFSMIGKIAGEEIRMKLTAPDARFAREQRIKQAALKLENVKNVSKFMGANRGQGDLWVLRACKYLFQKPGPEQYRTVGFREPQRGRRKGVGRVAVVVEYEARQDVERFGDTRQVLREGKVKRLVAGAH
jgi:hypothetical protein